MKVQFQPTIPILLLIFIVGLVGATIILKPSWRIGGDGFGYYSYIRSAVFDGDLNLQNEFAAFDREYGRQTLTFWRTPIGKVGNPFAIGSSILWSPFVLGARLIDSFFDFSNQFLLPGYNTPYQIALGIGTWAYAIAGIILVFSALRLLFSPWISLLATLAALSVSPLPFYLIYEPSMAHGLTVFTAGWLFYISVRIFEYARTPQNLIRIPSLWMFIAGVSIGLAFLVRWQDVLYGIIPISLLSISILAIFRSHKFFKIYHDRGVIKKIALRTCLLIFGFALISSPQLAVWKSMYGSLITVPQGAKFFEFTTPHLFDFLFSGYHGMFLVHPILLLAILGLILSLKQHGLLTLLALFVLLLQIYLNASISDWFAGASFGARRMVSAFFIFSFGFAGLFAYIRRRRILCSFISLIIILGFVFNGLLMVSYARGILPLDKPTSRGEIYIAPLSLF